MKWVRHRQKQARIRRLREKAKRGRIWSGRQRTSIRKGLKFTHGPKCHWCGGLMDFDLPEAPDFATVEHVRPLSQGGPNNRRNLRLVHKRCNR